MAENESDIILNDSVDKNIAFLVVGDVFCATTHSDLYLRAIKKNIKVKVYHNASIMNACSCTGLQLYNFGQTITIPLFTESWRPDSFYKKIGENIKLKLHTLVLLDIKVKEPNIELLSTKGKIKYDPPRYMTCSEGIQQLLEVENNLQQGYCSKNKEIVCLARVGQNDQKIVFSTFDKLKNFNMGKPLHCLIIPGEIHPLEREMLELFSLQNDDQPAEKKEIRNSFTDN